MTRSLSDVRYLVRHCTQYGDIVRASLGGDSVTDSCLDACLGIRLGGAALGHTGLPLLYLVALLALPLFFRFVVLVK